MTTATLEDIIKKTRKLTGTGNNLQLKDSDIIDYINSFYLYDFPSEFRSLQLKNTYTLNTVQNVDTYPFDYDHYSTLEAPAYVNKKLVPLYTSPWPFYTQFFNWQNREILDTGDGTDGSVTPYAGTLENVPINRSYNNNPQADTQLSNTSTFPTTFPPTFTEPNPQRVQNLLITANTATGTLNVTDDGDGNLIGDCTAGTINYVTGAVAGLIFTSAVPSGTDIYCSYNPANASIPQAVLFYQNQITVRPVPDAGYTVEIVAYRRPSQAMLGTSTTTDPTGRPELLEWWETIAFGAAKKIYEDRQDMEGVAMMDKALNERYALNETRTYAQLGKQQMGSLYRGQLEGFGGGSLFGYGVNNG